MVSVDGVAVERCSFMMSVAGKGGVGLCRMAMVQREGRYEPSLEFVYDCARKHTTKLTFYFPGIDTKSSLVSCEDVLVVRGRVVVVVCTPHRPSESASLVLVPM